MKLVTWVVIFALLGCDLAWAHPPTEALRARRASERTSATVHTGQASSHVSSEQAFPQPATWRDRTWWLRLHDRTRVYHQWVRLGSGFVTLVGFLCLISASMVFPVPLRLQLIAAIPMLIFIIFLDRYHLIKRPLRNGNILRGIWTFSGTPAVLGGMMLTGLTILFIVGTPGVLMSPRLVPILSLMMLWGIVSAVGEGGVLCLWPEEWQFLKARSASDSSQETGDSSRHVGLDQVQRIAEFALKQRLPFLARTVAQELIEYYLDSPSPDVRDRTATLIPPLLQVYEAGASSWHPDQSAKIQTEVNLLLQRALQKWNPMEAQPWLAPSMDTPLAETL